MRGTYGLTFIIFGLLVWLGRWADISVFRALDPKVLQAIALLMVFGCAMILVRLMVRFYLSVSR
jgi:hypothetical protein